MAPFEA